VNYLGTGMDLQFAKIMALLLDTHFLQKRIFFKSAGAWSILIV
jgi:hypothetical protein